MIIILLLLLVLIGPLMAEDKMHQAPIIKVFSGPEAREYIHEIATIRIILFKEYPYLKKTALRYI